MAESYLSKFSHSIVLDNAAQTFLLGLLLLQATDVKPGLMLPGGSTELCSLGRVIPLDDKYIVARHLGSEEGTIFC